MTFGPFVTVHIALLGPDNLPENREYSNGPSKRAVNTCLGVRKTMGQLEEIPIELGCVCEAADDDGLLGYCYAPATFCDPEADETRPIYFCEAHRPAGKICAVRTDSTT